MFLYVGLDVSQKTTACCIVDDSGRRLWRGECRTPPDDIAAAARRHAGDDARIGIETGSMTPCSHSCRLQCLDLGLIVLSLAASHRHGVRCGPHTVVGICT